MRIEFVFRKKVSKKIKRVCVYTFIIVYVLEMVHFSCCLCCAFVTCDGKRLKRNEYSCQTFRLSFKKRARASVGEEEKKHSLSFRWWDAISRRSSDLWESGDSVLVCVGGGSVCRSGNNLEWENK